MRRDASTYIRANFRPEDRLAVVLIQQEGEEKGRVEQKFWSAAQAAAPKTQAWLRYRNAHGWDVYASANPLRPGARGRRKQDVLEARWLYLDADRDGDATLKRIDADAAAGRIPQPTAVVNTSPGRYQMLWRIRGTETARAEDMLRRLAHHYGTDRAATDCARVLRLPGFRSRKRDAAVRLPRYSQGPPSSLEDFPGGTPLRRAAKAGTPRRRAWTGPGPGSSCARDATRPRSRRSWRHGAPTSPIRPSTPAGPSRMRSGPWPQGPDACAEAVRGAAPAIARLADRAGAAGRLRRRAGPLPGF